MNSFIEEFYYGNIDPQARSFDQNKKVQRDMQTLNESEDFLTDKLSGEEKKRFIQYVDTWASVNGESTLDSCILQEILDFLQLPRYNISSISLCIC
ncbi:MULTISPECIES: DUF6809 family protein [unclassified Ruminococcus]|uniref:DUF6809 family protein n=1 Tax=unclassified Ruminococcus TaxID=2608920 RepID=UPI0021095AB4|nr:MULTISPECIES: DUF6809 family protein [unclassified Ruminococcus]MCQ4023310.1 hypothetical protein [Ruminococcus sp. zg-924]MCQ4115677.1 hypothetical protein [Ruminococcus sp. zg-921]